MNSSMLVSKPCNYKDLLTDNFRYWFIKTRETVQKIHRKDWEWAFISQALLERGMLVPGKKGLGFAVGTEPLVAIFADYGCQITATDLYEDQNDDWKDTHQMASGKSQLNERWICHPDYFNERVDVRSVDMNSIPEDLIGFDFCWSSCAMEHLGSIENGKRFLYNSLKCLKSGEGVAVHTTEYNVNSNSDTLVAGKDVIFRRCDLEEISRTVKALGWQIFLTFEIGDTEPEMYVDEPPYHLSPHLKLRIGNYVATSYGLILQRKI